MKHVTVEGDLSEFSSVQSLCVIHARSALIDWLNEGRFDFFTRLAPKFAESGIASVVVDLDSPLSDLLLAQPHMHVIFGSKPFYAPNVVHVAPSYVWGFWYLDEVGVNADSSLRMRTFRPHGVEWGDAEWFFNGVASYMLSENVSREPQAPRSETWVERARSVVFCQEIDRLSPRQHYLNTEDMIRNAARAAGGGAVYVKPHPNQSGQTRAVIDEIAAGDPNILVSEASVHDLIEASDWVITQNSAAGFEALLQKKPVITCARCDYHHATLTAKTGEELRAILRAGTNPLDGFDYEKYVYWFLGENCLEPQKEDFADIAWARIADKWML
ncbi:MAG: hypothetical protein AAF092_16070 [Pseudomonadota bacterium]